MIGLPINKFYTEAVVASAAQLSAQVDLGGSTLAGVQSPVAISGTAMGFQGSTDGTTYCDIVIPDGGTAYSVTIGASKITPVNSDYFKCIRFLKLNCTTTQTGARSFGVISTI